MEKLACLYPTVSDKADTGCPQENEHQQRGSRTLDNSEYPFEIGAAASTDKIEYPFKIGPAAHLGENKYPFEIGPATLIDKFRIPLK